MSVKRKPLRKNLKCTNCNRDGHTSLMCFNKRRKPIKHESDKKRATRMLYSTQWFNENPSGSDGKWPCYLQIHPWCPKRTSRQQLQLEHVYPKNKYPQLVVETLNIKSACAYCNKLKLSNTINQLCKFYPNLVALIRTPEWQYWEDQMEILASRLGLRLDRPDPAQMPVVDLRH